MPIDAKLPYDDANIFARILRGELPCNKVYEDEWAIAFHDTVRVGILPLERVRAFGDPALIFLNVNTSDELAQAEAVWLARGSSPS